MEKNKFKEFRLKASLSIKDACHLIKISRQSLSAIENGRSVPRIETVKKMTEIYKCDISDLI